MAKKKPQAFRRSIRIGGELETSPSFPNQVLADEWYQRRLGEKNLIKFGFLSGSVPTFMEYSAEWFKKRMKSNPMNTWYNEETKLRTYLLPNLSELPLDKITMQMMREVLNKVTESGKSISTRTAVKALASKIFTDAMNENPPLCSINPCSRLKFSDARKGKKKIKTLEDQDEIISYVRCAAEISAKHCLLAMLGVMAGLRKSEKIALRWRSIKTRRQMIEVSEHLEQASRTILPGTKAGSDESREVFVPLELIQYLNWYRSQSAFGKENDFILCDKDGGWIKPEAFHTMIAEIEKRFGRKMSDHKLRHAFGRHFAAMTGNLQALQQQLGHKQIQTTQIYSELSGRQLETFKETSAMGMGAEIASKMSQLSTIEVIPLSTNSVSGEAVLKQRRGKK